MRDLEAAAGAAGTHERVLQERAGLGVADAIEAEVASRGLAAGRAPRVLVLAGSGNNGRDGVVAGRRLLARGWLVQVWHGPRTPLSEGETRDLITEGAYVSRFDLNLGALASAVEGSDVVIDALLGIGSRGALREELAAVARVVEAPHPNLG